MATDKKDSKNPFTLLSKSSRETVAKKASQSLKDPQATEPLATSSPAPAHEIEFVEKTATVDSFEPNQELTNDTPELSRIRGAVELKQNSDLPESKPGQEQMSNKSAVAKERKKPGRKKKYVEENAPTTVARVSGRTNHILNLIGSIERKTHNEIIEEMLMNHPLYAKIKNLL